MGPQPYGRYPVRDPTPLVNQSKRPKRLPQLQGLLCGDCKWLQNSTKGAKESRSDDEVSVVAVRWAPYLVEELHQGALDLAVGGGTLGEAAAADGVNLVHEDDARLMVPRIPARSPGPKAGTFKSSLSFRRTTTFTHPDRNRTTIPIIAFPQRVVMSSKRPTSAPAGSNSLKPAWQKG